MKIVRGFVADVEGFLEVALRVVRAFLRLVALWESVAGVISRGLAERGGLR